LHVAKPWKCRFRLHDWDDRENPKTHEHYQVCLRCNALALQATKRRRRGVAFRPQDTNGRQTLVAWHGVHGRVTPFSCRANLRFLSP
jgi:ribosomal protein L40E